MVLQLKNRYGLIITAVLAGILLAGVSFSVLKTSADSLVSSMVRFDRMKAATAGSTIHVTFTVPATNVGTEASVRISFPNDFTIATSGISGSTVACAGGGVTALPGALTVTGSNTPGSKSLTIATSALAASTTYCVDLDKTGGDTVTNPAAGSYWLTMATLDGSSAVVDSVVIATRVIADDQIIVHGVIAPYFNFVLDANSTDFTSGLDAAVVTLTNPRTITINTNATNGWITWAKDLNVGLTSAGAGKTIASTTPGTAATLAAGTEGYVLGVDYTDAASGGTLTVVPAYAGTSGDADGSGLDASYRQIASSDGQAGGDVLTLYGKAAVNTLTPAGIDYTDTWTIIGAGSF